MSKILTTTKDADGLTVYFKLNNKEIATMRASMGFNHETKQAIITDWNIDFQVASVSLMETQALNDHNNAVQRITAQVNRLVMNYRNKPLEDFLALALNNQDEIL